MNSKEKILGRLRQNTRETYETADLSFPKTVYDDPVAEFIHATTTTAGARLMEIGEGDDLNQKIREAYPEAKLIATNIPGISATLNPDTVTEAQELERTDVGIPQTMKERAVCFMAEYLVILVSRKDIVSNMHEAYRKIEFTDYGFGTFISGPSKTADIEQALVYGAQAARGVTVMLMP